MGGVQGGAGDSSGGDLVDPAEPAEPGGGPAAVRLLIGSELQRMRVRRGITRAQAAYEIRGSVSKLSRMELGRVGFKARDVADLLMLYGVADGPERQALLDLVQRSNERGWWRAYSDVTPHWFGRYLSLEATATLIRSYEAQFVPGLLQTESYARAVVRLGHPNATDTEIDRRVALRLRRQQEVLHRPDPPKLWAVVDEAVLLRPVGGRRVMRDQLDSLAAIVTKVPTVRLQVIPLAAGGHAATGGSFSLLRFGTAPTMWDVAYAEQLDSALYLERREEVEVYFDAVNRLHVEAVPPRETVEFLHQVAHESYSAG